MKQNITSKQHSQLSIKGRARLNKWWVKNANAGGSMFDGRSTYPLPLLSIGQMIELLIENQIDEKWRRITFDERMCYALWEEVKKVLEK